MTESFLKAIKHSINRLKIGYQNEAEFKEELILFIIILPIDHNIVKIKNINFQVIL